MSVNRSAIEACLVSAVTALGYELWGFELLPGTNGSLLRVYIDKPTGVMIDECAAVSRQIGSCLEVEDLLPGRYTLEVSSPGVERVLFKPEQYTAYVGSTVRVKLMEVFEGRRQLKGILRAVGELAISIEVDGELETLSFSRIKKATLVNEVKIGKRD